MMKQLLRLSRWIDQMAAWVGSVTRWLILASVLISSGNAVMRKAFDVGSNAFLEIQWYLFSASFLLGAGYVLLHNAHVRIDFVSSRLSRRTNAIIDVLGLMFFAIPLCLIFVHLSWPLFQGAWTTGETSQNAGGLIRWPVLLLLPAGFSLLLLQVLSELIKRVAFLQGLLPSPFSYEQDKSDEEILAEELAKEHQSANSAKAAS